ncbi:MAG TPA: S8 family serine peptidase [Gaiellaceae bacterium]|nr:S8 family serine peptidase [Gaiellaceae bacterium]
MSCVAATVAALCAAPIATADRVVSVGYRTPSALHGLNVVSRIPALRTAEVRLANARAERALRSRPGIRYTQPVVSRGQADAPALPFPTGLSVPEWQWTAVHADLVPGWVQQAARTITIAVIDTGADVLAPSLAAKSPVTWNVANNVGTVHDAVGHGTFVASLAAGAITDASGLLGFGGEARLMIVQANRGSADFTDIDESNAITWAVDNGANIINLSIGGTQTSEVERNAIAYATQHGVLLVAAAGNSAEQGNPNVYPAALLGTSGLVVGASNAGGARASFSTTGAYVDVLAPGVDVLGALASGISSSYFTPVATPGTAGTYGYGSGTSYAAPEVAGAAALVWAANPSFDAAGVAATLEATAAGRGAWTKDRAFGTINVAAAVQRATGGPAPTLSQPVLNTKPKAQPKGKARAAAKKAKRTRP